MEPVMTSKAKSGSKKVVKKKSAKSKKKVAKKKVTKKKVVKKKVTKKKVVKKPIKKGATKKKASVKKKGAGKVNSTRSQTAGIATTGYMAVIAPSQPVEYNVMISETREELVSKVNELLYIAFDGTVWVPQGAAFKDGDDWCQTLARFE